MNTQKYIDVDKLDMNDFFQQEIREDDFIEFEEDFMEIEGYDGENNLTTYVQDKEKSTISNKDELDDDFSGLSRLTFLVVVYTMLLFFVIAFLLGLRYI